ncbi:hypothetical protein [Clostridium lacusfryxellense]|uniref:hypothetical protein n=1 Tax=Clostridium lacusfryxellense TaxID=205328 RepID=UPI001C0ADD2B|nr:hypothetical protein [Clostridium lacusfryxellense]MBU3112470.1 hypothetical protein [Clostridium lacusfryxellense]
MVNEINMVEKSREIFFTNEFEKIKTHYKELKNLAIKSNPSDKDYIEYLELDFNRAIEQFIKEATSID